MGDEKQPTAYEAMCLARDERLAKEAAESRRLREEGEIILERIIGESEPHSVGHLMTPLGIVVVRAPTPAELRMYQNVQRSDKASSDAKLDAEVALAKKCVLHPPPAEYQVMAKKLSVLHRSVFIKASDLGDQTTELEVGK